MGLKYRLRKSFAAVIGLLLVLSASEAFGQGKHGGKKGKEHKQEWSDRKAWKQQEKSDRKAWKQQERSDRESRRQQRDSDRESRRQQQWSDWNSRRQQEWSDRESRRQQRRSDWESRRQQRESNRRGRWNRGDDDDDDDDDRGRRRNRRVSPNYGQIFLGDIFNGGAYRTDQRRLWKEQRRALKEERKALRRYERDQRRYARYYNADRGYGYFGGDDNNYNDYNNGFDWKSQLAQIVIANVLGNRLGGDRYDVLSQAVPAYGVPVNYGYQPVYNSNYGQPSYSGIYQPAYGYGDSPLGGNSLISGLLSSPLVGELLGRYAGDGGIASELIGSFITQGYDKGFLAGEYARDNGYGDDQYRDPYTYQNGVYDPYSVSLGQNRELLSEGYKLGYEDALRNRVDYDPQSEGNTDLVSLLLNNVLGAV